MNPLSKAFVILVTLLTVALSCFSIALISTQEKHKKNAEENAQKLNAVTAQLALVKANFEAKTGEQSALNAQLQADKSLLATQLIAANTSASTAQFNLNKANADLEGATASNKIAIASLDRATKEREAYAKQYISALTQVQDINKKDVESNARIAELNDELRRTGIELNRFKEQYTAAAKQLEEASKEVSVLEERIGKQKLPTEVRVASSQTIQGAVTGTDRASNGVILVSVNVGEKDQVLPGMEFTISRGSDYVATMVVTTVDAGTAIGRVTNSKLPVSSGDAVYIRAYAR